MATIYMPSEGTFERIKSLVQGFWLELDEDEMPVLLLKLEASLTTSVINGMPIEIVLRNPNITPRSCTLYIYDIPKNPFYVSWSNFDEEDKNIKGFDRVAIKLTSSMSITLVLFNELSHPIFTTKLGIETSIEQLHNWLYKVYNLEDYKYHEPPEDEGYYFPETELKGFKIKILNKDNSKEQKLTIIAPEYNEEWRDNAPFTGEAFNYDDFTGDGKHGYYQELSIANNLSKFFSVGIDLFISPKNADGTEFTDFVIIYKTAMILIESKYVISEKQTKKHSAITKAVYQLKTAEKSILLKKVNLSDKSLSERFNNASIVSKVCLVNDRLILTDENSNAITTKFKKEELPLFISVSSFFQLVASLKLKNESYLSQNLIFNTKKLHVEFLNSDGKILYVREFSIEGLTIEEINKLGTPNVY
jgi:hypothetical protein